MNTSQRGVLTLLRSAVTQQALPLPEDFDLSQAYPLINAHKISAMAHEGAVLCGIAKDTPVMNTLFMSYCKALQVHTLQMQQLQRLFAALDENQLDYMPLKGSVMKSLYPKAELRTMGDADILIRDPQHDQVIHLLKDLGFSQVGALENEEAWSCSALRVDLHRNLFAPTMKALNDHYGDGWSLAKLRTGTRCAMTDEDMMIYLFLHFTKHFTDAGIGCRHMVDLWVYLRSHPQLDEVYIEAELGRLHFSRFYQNLRRTISAWFEDGPEDDVTRAIATIVFANGNWGTSRNAALAISVRESQKALTAADSRRNYIMRRVFPSRQVLAQRYPVLRKAPFLLPFCWVYYIVGKLFNHATSLKHHRKNLDSLTDENVNTRKRMLEFVGLDS